MWNSSRERAAKNCQISSCIGQVEAASKQQFESSWERKKASRLAEVYPVSGESQAAVPAPPHTAVSWWGSVPVPQICWDKGTTSVQRGCRESCGKNLVAKPGLEFDLCHRSSYTEKCLDFGDRKVSGRSGPTTLTGVPYNTPSHCCRDGLAVLPRSMPTF